MKYIVGVLVQGYATAEIEADSDKDAIDKAMELEHEDFKIDIEELDYDSSYKYREVFDKDGNQIK